MAKVTFEQAKIEIVTVEKAIESLNAAGVPVPQSLTEQLEVLKKVIEGNASSQVAERLNSTILVPLNTQEKHKPLLEEFIKLCGTKARLVLVVKDVTEGEGESAVTKQVIAFEAAGSSSTGNTGGGATGPKSKSEFNAYEVKLLKDVEGLGAADTVKEFTTAADAVRFCLNGGKNPANVHAGFGEGNSMVRVIGMLEKNPVFAEHFKITGKKVEKAEPAATTEEQPATTNEATNEQANA